LIRFSDEEFVSAVARAVDEARKLVEAGFEYVTKIDESRISRKRKSILPLSGADISHKREKAFN
jgi:hypothetical protein